MRISRIYINQPPESGHSIEISGHKAHYLTTGAAPVGGQQGALV